MGTVFNKNKSVKTRFQISSITTREYEEYFTHNEAYKKIDEKKTGEGRTFKHTVVCRVPLLEEWVNEQQEEYRGFSCSHCSDMGRIDHDGESYLFCSFCDLGRIAKRYFEPEYQISIRPAA